MEADFSGYATKAGLKCSDGRTIMPEAFQHMDGKKVPLVWQHVHNEPGNVLGHALLEARADGVYAYCYLNDTEAGRNGRALVQHGDVTAMSIYANQLVEKTKQVFHGTIREVSLVLSGANPGALIDNIRIAHSDGEIDELNDEAIIYTGLPLQHSDESDEDSEADDTEENDDVENDDTVQHGDQTVQDVYDSLTEDQKQVVHFMIGAALEQAGGSAEHSALNTEGNDNMSRNIFEQDATDQGATLSHEDVRGIVADAVKGGSLKEAVENYALQHGIENIDILFPDARALSNTPEFDKRRTEWVAGVLGGTHHSPFSRVKTLSADLTHEEARARGYIKGNFKKEEFFGLQKRTTGPTTVYKKQKLDRDDIVDITDLDVVAWLKAEMRLMLDEELARAILIGDGRSLDNEDKIRDPQGATDGLGIRSILHDHELYAATVNVNLDDANSNITEFMDTVLMNRYLYKGTGTPTFYTTEKYITRMLLERDKMGRRLFRNVQELADELRVASIVPVEVMESETDLIGIMVNLQDYTVGADKGGEINLFDDFDIDYNQYKYLIETRISGALTKIRSALVFKKTAAANALVEPAAPVWDAKTNTITVPSTAGVNYFVDGNAATAGAKVVVPAGKSYVVTATPKAGFYFENNVEDQWGPFTAPK